ncbi:MAG: 2TM domain-containing protein [Thermoplasmata archaeon]|nr:2TM domain-containing protein [Thermoplasmata archaeon]
MKTAGSVGSNANERQERARKLAIERYDFLGHLAVYLLVNGGLVGIWAYEWLVEGIQDVFWPAVPLGVWGTFVLLHCLSVYVPRGRWIEAETRRILRGEE